MKYNKIRVIMVELTSFSTFNMPIRNIFNEILKNIVSKHEVIKSLFIYNS